MDFMSHGHCMECPQHCPADIYSIMCDCWSLDPDQRPQPKAVVRDIRQLVVEFSPCSYNLNSFKCFSNMFFYDSLTHIFSNFFSFQNPVLNKAITHFLQLFHEYKISIGFYNEEKPVFRLLVFPATRTPICTGIMVVSIVLYSD